jgi:hypothetical protein
MTSLLLVEQLEVVLQQFVGLTQVIIVSLRLFYFYQGLWTPNEGLHQKKSEKNGWIWPTKYASAVPKNLGLGFNFLPCSEDYILFGHP